PQVAQVAPAGNNRAALACRVDPVVRSGTDRVALERLVAPERRAALAGSNRVAPESRVARAGLAVPETPVARVGRLVVDWDRRADPAHRAPADNLAARAAVAAPDTAARLAAGWDRHSGPPAHRAGRSECRLPCDH